MSTLSEILIYNARATLSYFQEVFNIAYLWLSQGLGCVVPWQVLGIDQRVPSLLRIYAFTDWLGMK